MASQHQRRHRIAEDGAVRLGVKGSHLARRGVQQINAAGAVRTWKNLGKSSEIWENLGKMVDLFGKILENGWKIVEIRWKHLLKNIKKWRKKIINFINNCQAQVQQDGMSLGEMVKNSDDGLWQRH